MGTRVSDTHKTQVSKKHEFYYIYLSDHTYQAENYWMGFDTGVILQKKIVSVLQFWFKLENSNKPKTGE